MFASATEKEGVEAVKKVLQNKSTVFAGPSGVGKDTVLDVVLNKNKSLQKATPPQIVAVGY